MVKLQGYKRLLKLLSIKTFFFKKKKNGNELNRLSHEWSLLG
jgi:hypothetical protein